MCKTGIFAQPGGLILLGACTYNIGGQLVLSAKNKRYEFPSTQLDKEVRRYLRRIPRGRFHGSIYDLADFLERKINFRRHRVGLRKFREELMRLLDKFLEAGKLVPKRGGFKIDFQAGRSSKQPSHPRRRPPRRKLRVSAVPQY